MENIDARGLRPDVSKHKLNLNAKFAPWVIFGGLMAFSMNGCVSDPRAGDVLVADFPVKTSFCNIESGAQITLSTYRTVPIAGGQRDYVWDVSVPGCNGDVTIPELTVQTSFSRP